MLKLIRADRFEALADAMFDEFYSSPESKTIELAPAVVIVPSLGVARWLQDRLAQRFGIAANVEFAFAAQWLWKMAARVVPGVAEASPFDPASLAWRIYRLLGDAHRDPDLAPLARYMQGAGTDALARMQLAERSAQVFDRLTTYRSDDWLRAWSAGSVVGLEERETERWQSKLWRVLIDELALTDRRHPLERFESRVLSDDARDIARLPRHVRLFAPTTLAPLYRRSFVALAQVIDVTWCALEPTAEYIGDLQSEARIAQFAARGDARAMYAQAGHGLLAAWGRQAIEQNEVLAELATLESVQATEQFSTPRSDSMLHRLQADIAALDESRVMTLDRSDSSLVIHACTSVQRQLEALHDDLLARFDADPTLDPHHVVVFVPHIDAAVAAIDTVFGQSPNRVPYRITGAASSNPQPLIAAWMGVIDLAGSRYAVEPVLAVLRLPACARRFGLDTAQVESIADWLIEVGARWGLDATHRVSLGLPPDARHTWAWAIERLVLGAVLAPASPDARNATSDLAPTLGALPLPALEGDALSALSGLLRFLQAVERTGRESRRDRAPEAWARWLLDVFDRYFLLDADDALDLRAARAAAAQLADDASRGACALPIPLALARDRLARALEAGAPGSVPSGAVTFASLGSLRGIPFRVVAVLGLDDGAFPRPRTPLEFDLMAAHPKPGDRDARQEDRGAMLDALLAARDACIFGATVRDARDNAARPASVLLEDLVDYLSSRAGVTRDVAWRTLARDHALHGFAPGAFDPTRSDARSHVAQWAAAARAIANATGARRATSVLNRRPLPIESIAISRIDVAHVVRLLKHPARYFLRDRLGAELEPRVDLHDEDEPFALDRQGGWALADRLQRAFVAGCDDATLEAIAAASAELPTGTAGALAFERIAAQLQNAGEIAKRCEAAWGHAIVATPVSFTHSGITLQDTLSGLLGRDGQPTGLLIRSPAELNDSNKTKAGDLNARIEAVIRHLLANERFGPMPTVCCARDRSIVLLPVSDASVRLATLIDVVERAQRSPLLCPPKTAWLVARGVELDKAEHHAWRPTFKNDGESGDLWWRALLGGVFESVPSTADFDSMHSAFEPWTFLDLVDRVYKPLASLIDESSKALGKALNEQADA